MQAVLDTLGGSFADIMDANLLPWAQLAWGAGGGQADTAVAASLVQRLDWQEMAFTLPGPHGLTASRIFDARITILGLHVPVSPPPEKCLL